MKRRQSMRAGQGMVYPFRKRVDLSGLQVEVLYTEDRITSLKLSSQLGYSHRRLSGAYEIGILIMKAEIYHLGGLVRESSAGILESS